MFLRPREIKRSCQGSNPPPRWTVNGKTHGNRRLNVSQRQFITRNEVAKFRFCSSKKDNFDNARINHYFFIDLDQKLIFEGQSLKFQCTQICMVQSSCCFTGNQEFHVLYSVRTSQTRWSLLTFVTLQGCSAFRFEKILLQNKIMIIVIIIIVRFLIRSDGQWTQ